jgi:hypothetical protein
VPTATHRASTLSKSQRMFAAFAVPFN